MSVSIPAGRINKLFGTDGGVMLSLYADFPADFDTDTPLLVTIDALEVNAAEPQAPSPHSPTSTPNAGRRSCSASNSASGSTRRMTTNSTWRT